MWWCYCICRHSLSSTRLPPRVENLELEKYLVGSYVEGCVLCNLKISRKKCRLHDPCQTIMPLIATLGSCCPLDPPLYTGIGNSQWCQPSILAFKFISMILSEQKDVSRWLCLLLLAPKLCFLSLYAMKSHYHEWWYGCLFVSLGIWASMLYLS